MRSLLIQLFVQRFIYFFPWGSRRWLQCRKEIELLSDLTYYVLTTLSGKLFACIATLLMYLLYEFYFRAMFLLSISFRISDPGWGVCQHHPGGPQQEKNPLANAPNGTYLLPHICALSYGQGLDLCWEWVGSRSTSELAAPDEQNLEPVITRAVLDSESCGDPDWVSEEVFDSACVCPAAGNHSSVQATCGCLLHQWSLLPHW